MDRKKHGGKILRFLFVCFVLEQNLFDEALIDMFIFIFFTLFLKKNFNLWCFIFFFNVFLFLYIDPCIAGIPVCYKPNNTDLFLHYFNNGRARSAIFKLSNHAELFMEIIFKKTKTKKTRYHPKKISLKREPVYKHAFRGSLRICSLLNLVCAV